MLSARSPLARRIVGLAAAPALLLAFAACSDDDGGDSAGGNFCDQARSLDTAFDDVDDPTSAEFGEALDRIRSMDPPAEIADDWNQMVSALDGLEDIDLENPDPEALADFDTEAMQQASDNVDAYMSEECGIE
jgi:hypothetical protein